jgi:hypothetical protein
MPNLGVQASPGRQAKRPKTPSLGTTPVTGGGKKHGAGGGLGAGNQAGAGVGLYTGNAGAAAANNDAEKYIRDVLRASGLITDSGSERDQWAQTALVNKLLGDYSTANNADQSLGIIDWMNQNYGAGYITQGKGKNASSALQQGTLADLLANTNSDSAWADYHSNTDPEGYFRSEMQKAGGYIPGGGNQDFQAWMDKTYSPQVQAAWHTAQDAAAAQGGAAGGGTGGTGGVGNGGAGGSQTTLPNGASGDFGGDPMNRRAWMKDQGLKGRLNQMSANKRQNIKGQYQDYAAGFGTGAGGGTPDAPGGTGGPATPNTDLSMADYLNGRDVLSEARAAYLLRPNTQRTPSSIGLGGRYSWWE